MLLTHPETLIHPVIHDKSGTHFFQPMTATQWYWPPAVGYAERNSASEAARHKLQTPAVTRPHTTLVEPPLGNASDIEADSAVHELRIAKANPNIDIGEKLLLSSPLWPRASSCSSSALLASYRARVIVGTRVGDHRRKKREMQR